MPSSDRTLFSSESEVVDVPVVATSFFEVSVDRFHHVSDLPAGLLDVDETRVFRPFGLDEGEKIVVGGQQDPVVLGSVFELVSVSVSECSLVSRCTYRPPTTS